MYVWLSVKPTSRPPERQNDWASTIVRALACPRVSKSLHWTKPQARLPTLEATTETRIVSSHMRVLVVDDDEPSCQLLAKILQRSGMEVDWTIDGLAAYAMALQQHY